MCIKIVKKKEEDNTQLFELVTHMSGEVYVNDFGSRGWKFKINLKKKN